MKHQFPHAVKSFKSQKHINITILNAEVDIAFNNANNKEDPAWLIQWVIDNKLVLDIILNILFKNLTSSSGAQINLVFQSVENQIIGNYFFYLYFSSIDNSSDMDYTSACDLQNHNRKKKKTICTIVILGICYILGSSGIFMKIY